MDNLRESSSQEKANLSEPQLEKSIGAGTAHQDELSALGILSKIRLEDQHHPMHWHAGKKWWIISVYCLLQVFVTITSTSYVAVEALIQEKFGGSTQVVTLGQSLFIVGNAVGPAFLGPLS